jgi:ankyrin repeat protein
MKPLLPIESERNILNQGVAQTSIKTRFLGLTLLFCLLTLLTSCQTAVKKVSSQDSQYWFKAAKNGNLEELRKLHSEKSIPWNFQDQNGVSALMMASRYGHLETAKFLLEHGADLHLIDKYDYNALSYAVFGPLSQADKTKMSVYLIQQKADPFKKDHLGTCPLFQMIEVGDLESIQQISWSEKSACDKIKLLGNDFSLIQAAEENHQEKLKLFFQEQKCP